MMTNQTTLWIFSLAAACWLTACTDAQNPQTRKTGKQDAAKQEAARKAAKRAKEAALSVLKKHKIEIDFRNKTITVPVVVNAPTDSIEYLLIHRNGKAHEAVLITHARPPARTVPISTTFSRTSSIRARCFRTSTSRTSS